MSEDSPTPQHPSDALQPDPGDDPVALLAARWGSATPPRRPSARRAPRGRAPEEPWSGAAPDARDPAPLKAVLGDVSGGETWDAGLRTGRLIAGWPSLVGPDVAAHVRPSDCHGGVLTVEADSPAWATSMRLLSTSLRERIARALGDDLVREVVVVVAAGGGHGGGGGRAARAPRGPRPPRRPPRRRRPQGSGVPPVAPEDDA